MKKMSVLVAISTVVVEEMILNYLTKRGVVMSDEEALQIALQMLQEQKETEDREFMKHTDPKWFQDEIEELLKVA